MIEKEGKGRGNNGISPWMKYCIHQVKTKRNFYLCFSPIVLGALRVWGIEKISTL